MTARRINVRCCSFAANLPRRTTRPFREMLQGIARKRDRSQLAAVPDDLSKIVFATGANPGARDVKDQTPPVPAGQAMMVS